MLNLRHLFVLVILCVSTTLNAQSNYADSILMNVSLADSSKLKSLHTWLVGNVTISREPVLKAANAAFELARKTKNPEYISEAYNDLGMVYYFQERYEDSGVAYEKGKEFAKLANNTNCLLRALKGISQSLKDNGEQVKALIVLKEMEALLPFVTDQRIVGVTYTHFCNVYTALHKWEEVESFSRKAISHNSKNGLDAQMPAAYYHLGNFFKNKGSLDSALVYIGKAKEGYRKVNNQEELAGMTMQIAQIYDQRNQPETAFREMEAALQIVEQNRDTAGIAFVNMEYGKLLLKNKRYEDAFVALSKSLQIFERLDVITYKKEIYHALSQYYEQIGNSAESMFFFKKFIVVRDSIEGAESRNQITALEARFENTKKEQKISQLDQENKNQRLQMGFISSVAALLFVGSLLAFILIRNRQRKHLLQEQQNWAEAVVNSTEAERKRIAADLHDGIAQQIAALKMHTGSLVRVLEGEQKKQAESLAHALDNTGNEVRHLAQQMMPRSLADLGLVAALEDLVWISFAHSNIKATTQLEQYTLAPNLNKDIALYRITQEAINNILKHSDAKNVLLALSHDTTHITLIIEDDGKGAVTNFQKTSANSLGLNNMQSRVKLCNGTISLHSKPNAGFNITVKLPILG
jgi:two-component system, NarL family, sensor kinase